MNALPRRSAAPERAREEDRELLRRYHERGDTSAREELIQRHLPLVRSLARRYAGRGESLEDIEQVGAIGLIKAIDRFELARDVSLATYATPNVVGEIKRHFRDKGWAIRVPRALQELNASMSGAIERLTARLGALAEHRRDRRGAEDDAGGGAGGDGGRLGLLDRLALQRPAATRSSTRWRRSAARTRSSSAPSTGPRWSRRSTAWRLASGRSCACASRRACRKRRSPSAVGLSQMHVSRLIRKSLTAMRDELLGAPPAR